jgi:hypothetical protein
MSHAMLATYHYPMRVCDSADFDGTNDSMARGAGLDGAADSKLLTFSFWVKPTDTTQSWILNNSAGGVTRGFIDVNPFGNQDFIVQMGDSGGTDVIRQTCEPFIIIEGAWNHVILSVDVADTAKRHVYVNDVSAQGSWIAYADVAMDFTLTDIFFARTIAGTELLDGDIAEFYYAPGQYIDLSLVSNRRKFRSASGKPVHLGSTGSVPTGTAPAVYFHLDDGEAVANFATNRGTGGNFTITGTLATGSTSPSD